MGLKEDIITKLNDCGDYKILTRRYKEFVIEHFVSSEYVDELKKFIFVSKEKRLHFFINKLFEINRERPEISSVNQGIRYLWNKEKNSSESLIVSQKPFFYEYNFCIKWTCAPKKVDVNSSFFNFEKSLEDMISDINSLRNTGQSFEFSIEEFEKYYKEFKMYRPQKNEVVFEGNFPVINGNSKLFPFAISFFWDYKKDNFSKKEVFAKVRINSSWIFH